MFPGITIEQQERVADALMRRSASSGRVTRLPDPLAARHESVAPASTPPAGV